MIRVILKATVFMQFLCLAGCATRVERVRVEVPVAVPCVADLDAAPTYPDTDAALKAAAEGPVRYGLISEGRIIRDRRLAELEAVARRCR